MTLAVPGQAMTDLGRWAEDARAAAAIAKSLARTPFVPSSLRDTDHDVTAANITAALLAGLELGLAPMAALRSIDVINGTPALRAMTIRAIVQAAGHDVVLDESTRTRAIVRARRKGTDEWQTSIWTIDRAKDLRLAGKDNWRTQPTAMLVARATAEACRLVASDVLLGLAYAAEELADGPVDEPAEATPALSTRPARRTAQRRTPPAVITAELPDPPADQPPPDPPPPEPVSDAQLTALHAAMSDLDIGDRDERLAALGGILGRDLTTSRELSAADASRCLDELARQRWNRVHDEQAPA